MIFKIFLILKAFPGIIFKNVLHVYFIKLRKLKEIKSWNTNILFYSLTVSFDVDTDNPVGILLQYILVSYFSPQQVTL